MASLLPRFAAHALALPVRRCEYLERRFTRGLLMRFVVGEDDEQRRWVVPDPANALPGRGFYVFALPAVLADAQRTKVFQRVTRDGGIRVPADLVEGTREEHAQHCVRVLRALLEGGDGQAADEQDDDVEATRVVFGGDGGGGGCVQMGPRQVLHLPAIDEPDLPGELLVRHTTPEGLACVVDLLRWRMLCEPDPR